MPLPLPALVAALVAALAGATVQGSIGFGLNLVVVPVVALAAPEALPASMIIMALPMTVMMMRRERADIDRPGVAWVTLGRIPGTALGVWVVTVLSAEALAQIIGGLVIVAALTSARSPTFRITPVSAGTIGFASGAMGTASSIGGPPVALLYQHQRGPVLRSTLATIYMIGILFSIGGLVLAGQVTRDQVVLAAVLMPAVAAGTVLSRRLHDRLDAGWLRPAVLAFAVAAGMITVARGLV